LWEMYTPVFILILTTLCDIFQFFFITSNLRKYMTSKKKSSDENLELGSLWISMCIFVTIDIVGLGLYKASTTSSTWFDFLDRDGCIVLATVLFSGGWVLAF
jgi:hypothetical protein